MGTCVGHEFLKKKGKFTRSWTEIAVHFLGQEVTLCLGSKMLKDTLKIAEKKGVISKGNVHLVEMALN